MIDDLKFAGKLPVVINKNGDTRDIFAPIKSSSCDIAIVSSKIMSDLYTDDKKGIKVKVEKVWKEEGTQNSTLFEGYMTPNTYSQHLSPNLDTIDMTAIDPLAVLKYVYIDDVLTKAKSISMGELLAKALALVKIDADEVWIEQSVAYTGEDGNIGFTDMLVQTNNFWDEGDDASSVYDAISECLRLFGYTLTFTGEKYMIYLAIADHDFGTSYRYFTRYRIEDGGYLTSIGQPQLRKSDYFFKHADGDWTTIDDNPTVSIDDTYDRISSVASTKIPNYSLSAFDMVSAEERDKYDAGDLNVQRNKIKGYNKPSAYYGGGQKMEDDEWYYIWNGVYVSPEFGLNINGSTVNGYANINQAYKYISGEAGNPNSYGGILNFYGGEANPVGTTRDPQEERSVEVKECITVFAPDNGTPPEFLEREDLSWSYTAGYSYGDGENWTEVEPVFDKINTSNTKFGVNKGAAVSGVSYSQKYENIYMSENAEQVLVIDLSQSYSRTGINLKFDVIDYSTASGSFEIITEDNGETYAYLQSGTAYTYPNTWRSDSVTVNGSYFNRFLARDSSGRNYSDAPLVPVWDRRKIILSITIPDGKKYQFNGREWVETEYITDDKAFYLKKLMNYKKIFTEDFIYDLIDIPYYNPETNVFEKYETYSLNEDGFVYYTRKDTGGVYPEGTEKGNKVEIKYYGASTNSWIKHIDNCEEGSLSIILPPINAVNATVKCDVYKSSLLGITGNTSHGGASNVFHTVNYKVTANADNYGEVNSFGVQPYFVPINASYIKAEHLNIDISLSVPETNLGQMFGESDINYQTSHSKKFRQSWDAPNFLVNTKHQIVSQSHSYVIVGNELADANKFSIGWSYNKIPCRPENFVMQGYKNYWSTIRKTYNRVLVPHKSGFSNCLCFIEVPDLPDDGHGRWLVVVSDSVDVKTNRHTITAVEDYGMSVNEISNYTVIEIPRKARNDRYNLPSVKK